MRRHAWKPLFILPVSLLLMGTDKGCVTSPTIDTIVVTSPITIKGNLSEFDSNGTFVSTRDGQVRLKVNATWLAWTSTVNKIWTYSNVSLNTGVNVLSGVTKRTSGSTTINGTIPGFILERKTDLASAGQQKVFLDWSAAGIDDKIKAMATHTLNGPLSATDLNTFVTGVKNKVASFFTQAYTGQNVTLVSAAGSGVHTVKFHGEDSCSLYGQSPGDYKNTNKTQTSEIYIGSFKCTVVDDNALLTETPAQKSDTLETRIADIGTFIGRTAAHEVGHSLGLVAYGDTKLHGDAGWHNNESYDNANPCDRADSGRNIMDAGPAAEVYARIGQCDPNLPRNTCTPHFNAYNKSYLEIIHP